MHRRRFVRGSRDKGNGDAGRGRLGRRARLTQGVDPGPECAPQAEGGSSVIESGFLPLFIEVIDGGMYRLPLGCGRVPPKQTNAEYHPQKSQIAMPRVQKSTICVNIV